MAVETQVEARELVNFSPEGFLVTSFFLNVDAGEFPSDDLLRTSFDSLMHAAESRRKDIEDTLSHAGEGSLRGDLAKIRELFDGGLDREDTMSIGIFSCSGQDFWQVIHMPMPVDNQVHFGPRPQVSPIAAFLSHTKPTAILLTDKQHARIFTMNGGDVREWTDFQDFVPQRTAQGGWSQNRYQRRSDHWKQHHLDHAADLVFRLLQHYPFDWLILGVELQTQPVLDHVLHPYVKDRVVGNINVRIDADAAEIVQKATEKREEIEQQHIAELITQIQEFAGAGGRGAIGLENTVQVLNEQRVHILLVQSGFTHVGSECPQCGLLSIKETETCTACGGEVRAVENIVDTAIQRAFELGSTVEIATEFDQLAPIDGVGAVLYY